MSPDGSGNQALVSAAAAWTSVRGWFPDSRSLFLESEMDRAGGWFDIYRINRDGTDLIRLTAEGGQSGFVMPSKIGDKLVYRRANDHDLLATIRTMNGDGSLKSDIASVGTALGHMFISPDGRQIAFCSDAGGNGINDELGVVSSAGGSVTWLDTGECQLVSDSAAFPSGPWSPDGQWLVYSAKVGGQWDLFNIRPNDAQKAETHEHCR